jgi:uncharacterized protein YcgL (UPF0745 family)
MTSASDPEPKRRLVKVYKTRRTLDMYLYVDHAEDLTRVPDALLERFGQPELALTLTIGPERRLARADAREVLAQIRTTGYYLQMPPADGSIDAEIRAAGD